MFFPERMTLVLIGRSRRAASRQAIAATLRHKERRSCRVALKFLSQPVNVSLQCARRDRWLISPYIAQQNASRNACSPRLRKTSENRCLDISESQGVRSASNQLFRSWAKSKRTDRANFFELTGFAPKYASNADQKIGETEGSSKRFEAGRIGLPLQRTKQQKLAGEAACPQGFDQLDRIGSEIVA